MVPEIKDDARADALSADFQALFDASPTPLVVVAPPHWIIVAANNAHLEVTGTTRAQQLGLPLFEVFPDDPNDEHATGVGNLRASFNRVLATRAADRMAVQRYPVRDAEGRFVVRWWCPINVPVISGDGDVSLVIHQVEEVTEVVWLRGEAEVQDKLVRKQQALIERLQAVESALRQQEHHLRLMVDELNHRVKNALAVVQSIVSQTLRGFGVREASEAVERRLVLLAAAHDVITAENWSGVDLRGIIGVAGAPYSNDQGVRFELEGPQVTVSPQTAISLALILHELATNAVKYGSLSVAGGTVRIRWSAVQRAQEVVLDLEWCERGGPPVTAPTRKGFGTRLIERSAGGMGSKARLLFEPDGLVCKLSADLTLPARPTDL